MENIYYTFKEYYDLEKRTFRRSREYEQWKYFVKKRDKFRCVECGSKKKLDVHHVKRYSEDINLRIKKKNGITLCRACHSKIHLWMDKEVKPVVKKATVILRKASADALRRLSTDPVLPKGTKQPPSFEMNKCEANQATSTP